MKEFKTTKIFLICGIILSIAFNISSQDKKDEFFEEAMEQLKSSNPLYAEGVNKYMKGDRAGASDALRKCIRKMPQHAYAHYYLANIDYIGKDFTSALAHIEKALAHLSDMQELSAYADEQKASKFDSLRGNLEEMWNATNSCRDSRAIEMAWDQLDQEEGKLEMVARQRKKAMERMKAHYLYFHGNILLQLRQYNDSLLRYQEAIRLNPQHADAYNNIIAILYLAKEYDKALLFWEDAETQGLDEQLNLKLKESLYEAMGRPTEGILSEDLTKKGEKTLGVMRFCLDFRRDGEMSPPLYENCYIVFDQKSLETVIIDPGVEDPRIEDFIRQKNLRVKAILNTHDHADHTNANGVYAKLYNAPVCAPKDDAKYYDTPPDRLLQDGETLDFGGVSIRVVQTPGHTDGSLCFLIDDYIFSGDTLFKNDIGKIWAEDENQTDEVREKLLLAVKEKILALPGNTVVCPGHGRTTTIAAEKANNPYFAD